jgi:hypothetical protein
MRVSRALMRTKLPAALVRSRHTTAGRRARLPGWHASWVLSASNSTNEASLLMPQRETGGIASVQPPLHVAKQCEQQSEVQQQPLPLLNAQQEQQSSQRMFLLQREEHVRRPVDLAALAARALGTAALVLVASGIAVRPAHAAAPAAPGSGAIASDAAPRCSSNARGKGSWHIAGIGALADASAASPSKPSAAGQQRFSRQEVNAAIRCGERVGRLDL